MIEIGYALDPYASGYGYPMGANGFPAYGGNANMGGNQGLPQGFQYGQPMPMYGGGQQQFGYQQPPFAQPSQQQQQQQQQPQQPQQQHHQHQYGSPSLSSADHHQGI